MRVIGALTTEIMIVIIANIGGKIQFLIQESINILVAINSKGIHLIRKSIHLLMISEK